jgi:small conductance mechanosensitive channel
MSNMIEKFFQDNRIEIIQFVTVLLVGYIVIKILVSIFNHSRFMAKVDPTVGTVFVGLMKFMLYATYMIVLLSLLGVPMTTFIAMMSAIGLAIALALQGNLSNFASAIMILIFKPFKVGDFIQSRDNIGTVKEIQILFTHILTPDNCKVIIPNSELVNGRITNYTSEETRRVDLQFSTSYDDNIEKVKEVLEELIRSHEMILQEPVSIVRLAHHNASSLDYDVKVWVDKANYWAVRYDLQEMVRKEFDKQNITIPLPQREVLLTNSEMNKDE